MILSTVAYFIAKDRTASETLFYTALCIGIYYKLLCWSSESDNTISVWFWRYVVDI